MNETPKHGGYLRQAWLVLLLALLYGAALAGVQTTLGPKIAENKRDETYGVIPTLVPGAAKEQLRTMPSHMAARNHLTYRFILSPLTWQGEDNGEIRSCGQHKCSTSRQQPSCSP